MKKFEYITIANYNHNSIHTSELNKLGSEGWELVSITILDGKYALAYLKREII